MVLCPLGNIALSRKQTARRMKSFLHSRNNTEAVGVPHGWSGPAPIGTKDHRKLSIEGVTEDEIPERFFKGLF